MYGRGGDPSVGTAHGPMTKLCQSDTIFACLFIYLFDVYDNDQFSTPIYREESSWQLFPLWCLGALSNSLRLKEFLPP